MTVIGQEVTQLFKLLNQPSLSVLTVKVEIVGEVQLIAQGPGPSDVLRVVLKAEQTVDLLQYAPLDWWRSSTTLHDAVSKGWLSLPDDQSSSVESTPPETTIDEQLHYVILWKPVDGGAVDVSPTGHARQFFDATTRKLKVSENGGDFVNLVHPQGVAALVYAASVALDFDIDVLPVYRSVALAGDVAFTTSNLAPGTQVSVRIVADGSSRNFTFPGGWKFLTTAAPASIAANKTAILSLVCYGTTDADIVAAYAVEP